MNKIRNYWKNKRGITLIWGAILLVLCLMFLGLAVDIAYMYVVKNQLQVAADSSSLAGSETLTALTPPVVDNSLIAFQELDARKQTWKFACKNIAAGDPVFLVNNFGRNRSAPDCDNVDSFTASDLNGATNDRGGDIVVGHWRFSPTCPSSCTTGGSDCETTGSGSFCRANGSTGLTINAVKTRPRRTGTVTAPDTPGMPPVSLFVGQIFRILGPGPGWSFMSARASAIAYRGPKRPSIPIAVDPSYPLCDGSCPALFTQLILNPSSSPGTNAGWTLFCTSGSPTGSYCQNPSSTNTNELRDDIKNDNNPDVCSPIYLTSGMTINTGVHDPALGDMQDDYTPCCPCPTWLDDSGQPHQADSCTVPGVGSGCVATVPKISTGTTAGGACEFTGTKLVTGLIDICITEVVPTGANKHITAYVLGCYTCDDAPIGLSKDTKLVR